jgi:hypothetical protein
MSGNEPVEHTVWTRPAGKMRQSFSVALYDTLGDWPLTLTTSVRKQPFESLKEGSEPYFEGPVTTVGEGRDLTKEDCKEMNQSSRSTSEHS